MELLKQFAQYSRLFSNSPQIPVSSQKAQENHAEKVITWMNLTQDLQYLSSKEKRYAEDIFDEAKKSAYFLFAIGDEITAWIGQKRVALAVEQLYPGLVAAQHLAASARLAINQSLCDEATDALNKMRRHFKETDHALAAQYWETTGMILNFKKEWVDAIPCFQLSREHIELSSRNNLKLYLRSTRNNLLAHQNLSIADCLMGKTRHSESKEKLELLKRIRLQIDYAGKLLSGSMLKYLLGINEVELQLLEGDIESAQKNIHSLLGSQNIKSRSTSVLHPGAYVMKAKIANMRGDLKAMTSYLSKALAESTMMFPDVMQELQVVDYALDMISENTLTRNQWKPLLESMVIMLEAKDWYTGRDHSKSVAKTTLKLWEGWQGNSTDQATLDDLYWAGYLHDIGKLRLPRSLLNKIAPLCEEEWVIIRRHPSYTQQMLDAIGTGRISVWAGQHHQDIEGNGYPGRKPASKMGICIAIADILEAATNSNRKYQKPKTKMKMIDILRTDKRKKYPSELLDVAEKIDLC